MTGIEHLCGNKAREITFSGITL